MCVCVCFGEEISCVQSAVLLDFQKKLFFLDVSCEEKINLMQKISDLIMLALLPILPILPWSWNFIVNM